ncbi:unnamed protein product [Parajaminaea phylloscopi]
MSYRGPLQDESKTTLSGSTTPVPAVLTSSSKVAQPKPRPWWRRPKALAWVLILLAAVAVGIALGVYYGLRNRVPNDGKHHKALKLPSGDLAADIFGLRETGAFLSTSDDYKQKIFTWYGETLTLQDNADPNGLDIVIDHTDVQQVMDGFGAGFTDSSCWLLYQLKQSNASDYNKVMDYFFNRRTGFSTIRVPIAASDYSAQGIYTYAEYNASASQTRATQVSPLAAFSINKTREYILPVLRDARSRRPDLKIMMSAWTPPAWMKTNNSTNGGQLIWGQESLLAEYLARTVDAFAEAGVAPDSLTIQNEPTKGTDSYPTNWMSAATQALVAAALRTQLRDRGHGNVKIFAHDDNWNQWLIAVDAIMANASAFDGIAWHCYGGDASGIDNAFAALNASAKTLETHLTECTTTDDRDNQWYSTQYWLQNNFFASINRGTRSIMTWNIVLDKKSKPYIENAPCHDCLGTFTVTSPDNFIDPSLWVGNAQFLTTFHFAAATANLTEFGGGAATRVTASKGTQNPSSASQLSCLSGISAFSAPWNGTSLTNSTEKRIGLVVQNDCQSKVSANIGIDGRRLQYKFAGGVTTLLFNV